MILLYIFEMPYKDIEKKKAAQKRYRLKHLEQLKIADKIYRKAHPEKARERVKRYGQRHPERIKEQQFKRYWDNPEFHRARAREWLKKNRDRKSIYDQQYSRNNRKKKREYLFLYKRARKSHFVALEQNRRAKIVLAGGEWSRNDIASQFWTQNGRCYYCCIELSNLFHADHIIPLSKGGTNHRDNLAIACQSCNCAKRDKSSIDFALGLLKWLGVHYL